MVMFLDLICRSFSAVFPFFRERGICVWLVPKGGSGGGEGGIGGSFMNFHVCYHVI